MRIAVNGTELYVDVEGARAGPARRPSGGAPHDRGAARRPGVRPGLPAPGLAALSADAQLVFLDLRGQGRSGTACRRQLHPGADGRRRGRRVRSAGHLPSRGPRALGRRVRRPAPGRPAPRRPRWTGPDQHRGDAGPGSGRRPTARTRGACVGGRRRDRRSAVRRGPLARDRRPVQPVGGPLLRGSRARRRPGTAVRTERLRRRGGPALLRGPRTPVRPAPAAAGDRRPGAGRHRRVRLGLPAGGGAHHRAGLADADYVQIPGAGHFPFAEEPAAFQGAVRAFLARVALRAGDAVPA